MRVGKSMVFNKALLPIYTVCVQGYPSGNNGLLVFTNGNICNLISTNGTIGKTRWYHWKNIERTDYIVHSESRTVEGFRQGSD